MSKENLESTWRPWKWRVFYGSSFGFFAVYYFLAFHEKTGYPDDTIVCAVTIAGMVMITIAFILSVDMFLLPMLKEISKDICNRMKKDGNNDVEG